MNIQCVRLNTGEELIADLSEELLEAGIVRVLKPLQILIVPGPDGKMNVAMQGFVPYRKGPGLDIPGHSVAFVFEPNDELAKAYRQATSPIQLADNADMTNLPPAPGENNGPQGAPTGKRPNLILM
jgi:hypothetical protein